VKPFKTVAEKYSPSDVSIILFTDENIFTVTTLKNTQKSDCNASTYAHQTEFYQSAIVIVNSPSMQPAVLDNMGLPAGTRNSSGAMGVGNYSLTWRLLPLLVLPKYSLNNRADRINMVIDYQT